MTKRPSFESSRGLFAVQQTSTSSEPEVLERLLLGLEMKYWLKWLNQCNAKTFNNHWINQAEK